VKKKSKYEPFDPADYLTSEEAFEECIIALREDGATEELIEDAYRDIERARIIHGIPKPATPTATPTAGMRRAVSVA
jgi:DNA-binding phage protein